MLPNAAGRFCGSCNKNVIDFTVMTNQQIIDHLAASTSVCGRLSSQQFNSINQQLHLERLAPVSLWKKAMLVVSLLASTQLVKAQSNVVKPGVEQFADSELMLGKVVAPTKSLKTKTLTGVVIDERGKPLPQVQVSGGNLHLFTDIRGMFTLQVPGDTKVIRIAGLGWNTQTLIVKNKQGQYTVVMKEQAMILGGLGTIKQPKTPMAKYLNYIIKPIKLLLG